MNNDRPLTSVVIPAFNVERYVTESLNSANKQIDSDVEIIFINDGSSDNTLNVAERFLRDIPSAILMDNENRGVAYSRNCGIGAARGDYTMFLDADDTLTDGAIKRLVAVAEAVGADMVYGRYSIFKPDAIEDVREFDHSTGSIITPREAKLSLASMSPKSISGSCWRVLFRTDFLKRTRQRFPVGVAMSEDYHFILDCLDANPKIAYLDEVVYLVRRGSDSVTQRYMRNLRHDMEFVNRRLWQSCEGDPELERLYHACVANTAWTLIRNEFRNPEAGAAQARTFAEGLLKEPLYIASIKALSAQESGFDARKAKLLKVGIRMPKLVASVLSVLRG